MAEKEEKAAQETAEETAEVEEQPAAASARIRAANRAGARRVWVCHIVFMIPDEGSVD